MKKVDFLIACVACICTSCAVTPKVYTQYADITWMNEKGEPVRVFENAYIGSSFDGSVSDVYKVSGLRFTDRNGEETFISGGMIYCKFRSEVSDMSPKLNSRNMDLEKQLGEYRDAEERIRKEMEGLDKKSLEYKALNEELKQVRKKMTDIQMQRGY